MSNELPRLRLHSVEHFMLADSRASHPMTFFLRVTLAEDLEIERLRAAIHQCVRLHPLLAATIYRRQRAWYWDISRADDEILPPVTSHTVDSYAQSRSDWTFDLSRQSGLRISLSGKELWLQVHHSCCDARGLLDFLSDVQLQYSIPQSDTCLDVRAAAAKAHLPQRAIGFCRRPYTYLNVRGPKWPRIVAYFWNRSRPLASKSESGFVPEAFSPNFVQRELPLPPYSKISIPSRRGAATINDRLLQAMFEAMAEHSSRITSASGNPWLRIGMPIDMRPPGKPLTSACNASSLVFLDRRPQRILDARSNWAAGLSRETAHIKRERLGEVFFDCLEIAHRLPFAMRLAVADQRCAVTSVVSNLGRLEFPRMKPFSIERLDFLPPLRPGTRLALGASTLENRLSLMLHYDVRYLETSQATQMLDRIANSFTSEHHVSV